MSVIRTLLLLLLFSACIGAAFAAEVAVCTDSSAQIDPDVDGRYIVWTDYRGGIGRIALYDISTGTTAPIPPPAKGTVQFSPAISGDTVAFVSRSGDSVAEYVYEIRLYSIRTGTSEVIRARNMSLDDVDVYTVKDAVAVVWKEVVGPGSPDHPDSEIWLYSRTKGSGLPTVGQVSDGQRESSPRVAGGWIVWMHEGDSTDPYGGPYDVYARRVTGGTPVLVSTTTVGDKNTWNTHPDVSGSEVVWQVGPLDRYYSRILRANLSTPGVDPVVVRPTEPVPSGVMWAYLAPAISGDAISYVYRRWTPYDDEVPMVTEPGTGAEYGLSSKAEFYEYRLRFDGDTVVWVDKRAGNADIYMARVAPTPITGCTVIDEPGYYVLANDILDSACPVAIDIRCSNVLLDGGDHLVDGIRTRESAGVRIGADPAELDNVRVRNLRLRDWGTGVDLVSCSRCSVSNVSATGGGVASSGFRLDSCRGSSILSCSATEMWGPGVYAVDDGGILISGCTIGQCIQGMELTTAGEVTLEKNTVTDCIWGGVLGRYADSSRVLIRDNLVEGNGDFGFGFFEGWGEVSNNTIRENSKGIYLSDSGKGTIAGNIITGNGCGIVDDYHDPSGGGWRVYNNLFNNTCNARMTFKYAWNITPVRGPNIVGGPSIGGNYWAFPNGTGFSQLFPDLDGDGFCDEVYAMGSGNTDRRPLRKPGEPGRLYPFPGFKDLPRDIDLDGRYEDINGNNKADFADIVLYFQHMAWISDNEPIAAFDYNNNGGIDFADIIWLFNHL